MAANSQNDAGYDTEILDSVDGSATACAYICTELRSLVRTSAGCLRGPLELLAYEFDLIKPSYSDTYKRLRSNQSIMSPNATNAVKFAQSNCQKIAQELSTIVNECGVWDVMAPQGSCSRLSVLLVCLREQRMHLDLLNCTLDLSKHLINKPAVEARNTENAARRAALNMGNWSETSSRLHALVHRALRTRFGHLEEIAASQTRNGLRQDGVPEAPSENLPDADDWSSTQSSAGIMTPTDDWSDFGSDTTETCRASGITRHSLQLCQNETSNFLKLVGKVEQQFGDAPGSTPVDTETTQYLHEAYGDLVVKLLHGLAAPMPFQSQQTAPPAPEIIEPSLPEPQNTCAYASETLDAIIKSMESPIPPTVKEIMKLVFHWTTLNECNGFEQLSRRLQDLRLLGEVKNRPCYRSWTSSVIHDEDVRLLQKCHIDLVVHLSHGLNAPWQFQSSSVVTPPGIPVVNEDSLESCAQNVTNFMREIHNVRLGHAPASTPVDVRCLHRLYNGLANALLRDLATPAALDPGHEGVSGERTQIS
ncbi:hypothetical protein D6D17_03887 [Aureobasidium pullulans]|nr:hypothetical protein D6D17_03887 [Aureobasidium pullulans]